MNSLAPYRRIPFVRKRPERMVAADDRDLQYNIDTLRQDLNDVDELNIPIIDYPTPNFCRLQPSMMVLYAK